jgi:hypothetical protein
VTITAATFFTFTWSGVTRTPMRVSMLVSPCTVKVVALLSPVPFRPTTRP